MTKAVRIAAYLQSVVVLANSVPIFKGIKIYFSERLRENEFYREISKVIIDGRSYAWRFQLLTGCRYTLLCGGVR